MLNNLVSSTLPRPLLFQGGNEVSRNGLAALFNHFFAPSPPPLSLQEKVIYFLENDRWPQKMRSLPQDLLPIISEYLNPYELHSFKVVNKYYYESLTPIFLQFIHIVIQNFA